MSVFRSDERARVDQISARVAPSAGIMGGFCSKNNDGLSSSGGGEEEEEAHIHYRRPPDISNW